jgi:hypothetical protein
LNGPIARKDVPAPEARLDLLNVKINGAMLHSKRSPAIGTFTVPQIHSVLFLICKCSN